MAAVRGSRFSGMGTTTSGGGGLRGADAALLVFFETGERFGGAASANG